METRRGHANGDIAEILALGPGPAWKEESDAIDIVGNGRKKWKEWEGNGIDGKGGMGQEAAAAAR